MTNSLLLLDAILALTLVAIALRVLLARDLFQSIVLFIVFGMLLGIAWCRLEAVDVALAEVAIGAGLTGALLLNTLAATRRQNVAPVVLAKSTSARSKLAWPPLALAFAIVLFAAVLAGGLAAVVVPLARSLSAPRIAIGESLQHSGVTNPVTAVLLNFRAYDTLLEVAVLLAAVLAVISIGETMTVRGIGCQPVTMRLERDRLAAYSTTNNSGPVLQAFARLLVPLAVLVATYVLWIGTKAPGGAFQAAAILGAGGVLMIVCGARPPRCTYRRWRVLLVTGLGVFLLVAAGGIMAGGCFLELSPRWASAAILLVETALTASIALILIVLFCGTSPEQDENRAADVENEPTATGDPRDGGASDIQEPSP
jgi:multisubunit Na+/H+ antiporter MnhB subunit